MHKLCGCLFVHYQLQFSIFTVYGKVQFLLNNSMDVPQKKKKSLIMHFERHERLMDNDWIFIFRLNILLKRPNTSMFVADLTAPRSTMKQSPLLKLAQARGTSVARTVRLPLMWKSRRAVRSLVTTWWNPDATPPAWEGWKNVLKRSCSFFLFFHL